MSDKFQSAIDFINNKGGNVYLHTHPFKLLLRLSQSHNIDMNGGKGHIQRKFGFSKKKILELSRYSLEMFSLFGDFIIPSEFLYRQSKRFNYSNGIFLKFNQIDDRDKLINQDQ